MTIMKLIDKDAVVAKIKKLREYEIKWMDRQGFTDYHMGVRDAYTEILESLYQNLKKLRSKEIEQVCISGGEAGVGFARDPRYKENLEMKEVDLEKEIQSWIEDNSVNGYYQEDVYETAKHFLELGLKTQKGE